MLTRSAVTHQYGEHYRNASPPPFHILMPDRHYPQATGRAQLYGAGGMLGGHVTLAARGLVGQSRGNTGYGYLGMDPSDPLTWPRPFVPTAGMISYLNYGAGS
jgi:hypothetical protein